MHITRSNYLGETKWERKALSQTQEPFTECCGQLVGKEKFPTINIILWMTCGQKKNSSKQYMAMDNNFNTSIGAPKYKNNTIPLINTTTIVVTIIVTINKAL